VVDGHHRVAMAKQMGIDALDAHVVEYRVDGKVGEDQPGGPKRDESAT
jgi:ParB-like chromosome segregation protein Spo0J